ncbi:MAG: SprB repeat-containing protein, partial [Bacteroidales bacterium]|nr:SprB repeat-containing protein [Bacteroidales bacterium]
MPTVSSTDVLCSGGNNGSATITVDGGSLPYSFSWNGQVTGDAGTDQNPSNLSADTYTLTVTDNAGCVKVFADLVTIAEPEPLSASFIPSDANCFESDNGTINVTVTGGTLPYTYIWSGPGGFSSGDEDISELAPGDYSLELSDANGCSESYPDVVTINEPSEITIAVNATNISCNGAGDGAISITASGGTPGYTYLWSGPDGFTSEDQNLSPLEPGEYDLTVTDNNTCTKIFNNVTTLTEPDAILVTFVSQTNLACYGDSNGTIEIDVSGGEPPYSFSWTDSQGTLVSTGEDPTGLPAGTYTLQVTDNGPCTVIYTDAVELTEPPELTTTLSKTDVVCSDESNGTITVT